MERNVKGWRSNSKPYGAEESLTNLRNDLALLVESLAEVGAECLKSPPQNSPSRQKWHLKASKKGPLEHEAQAAKFREETPMRALRQRAHHEGILMPHCNIYLLQCSMSTSEVHYGKQSGAA